MRNGKRVDLLEGQSVCTYIVLELGYVFGGGVQFLVELGQQSGIGDSEVAIFGGDVQQQREDRQVERGFEREVCVRRGIRSEEMPTQ